MLVNGWNLLINVTEGSTLNVVEVLDKYLILDKGLRLWLDSMEKVSVTLKQINKKYT